MQSLTGKITGDSLTAVEWNQLPAEVQNIITGLGISLSSGDLNQLGKAIAGYVANGDFYTDSGAADAYVLGVIGSKQRAPEYTDGFGAVFRAGNTNTGASTVNVAGLGVKNIKTSAGADPAAGDITAGDLIELRYDLANGWFTFVSLVVTTIDTFSERLLHIQDQKATTVDGGTFTAGAWRTRVLNTVLTNEISGASLSSNQITLPAGTYWIEANAPAYVVDDHAARLQNITDASTIMAGTSENADADSAQAHMTRSFISGRFTLAATKTIELQHQCETTRSNDGFGSDVGTQFTVVNELYSDVKIWKVG